MWETYIDWHESHYVFKWIAWSLGSDLKNDSLQLKMSWGALLPNESMQLANKTRKVHKGLQNWLYHKRFENNLIDSQLLFLQMKMSSQLLIIIGT